MTYCSIFASKHIRIVQRALQNVKKFVEEEEDTGEGRKAGKHKRKKMKIASTFLSKPRIPLSNVNVEMFAARYVHEPSSSCRG